MITFQILSQYRGLFIENDLQELARSAVSDSGLDTDGDLTIVINNQDFIHDLNFRYRDMDSSTDVLSFPAGYLDPDTGKPYHGDIIISFPDALQQALAANHGIDSELALLTIHGILHLAGYDHSTPEEQSEMWELQDRILAINGIKLNRS